MIKLHPFNFIKNKIILLMKNPVYMKDYSIYVRYNVG